MSWVVLAAFTGTALADSPAMRRAKRHIAKATQAYKAGRYEDARKEFATAYSIDPQPQLLFALGDVNVKLGHCDVAITFLQNYLETKPDDTQPANALLATCNAATPTVDPTQIEIDAPAKTAPASPPVASATDDELPPGIGSAPAMPKGPASEPTERPNEPPDERAWYQKPIGLTLCGGGALAVITAGVLYEMAVRDTDSAATTPAFGDALALVDNAHTLRAASIVSAGVGIALLGAGGYYYYRHRSAPRDTHVTAIPTARGGLIGLAGSF